MGFLGKAQGRFSLIDSDHNVGSFFSVEDIYQILEIDRLTVAEFKDALIRADLLNKDNVVDEKKLWGKYKNLKEQYSTIKLLNYTSLDECIIKQIFVKALPGATITQQVPYKNPKTNHNKWVDFKIEYKGLTRFVEIDGPQHFSDTSKAAIESPFDKKHQIEDILGSACVMWPFWIQRCELNAKAIFDKSIKGCGALWSSKCLFGSFNIPSPGQLIIEENKQFNAERDGGIGYFYGGDTENRNIPEHPVIALIEKGKKSINEIIPSDITENKAYWVPKKLQHLL